MVLDVLIGIAFGGAAAWAAYAGFYDKLTWRRGQPARSLPASFWRRSLSCAVVGAVIGGILMWTVRRAG